MSLQPIEAKDLLFTDETTDERTNTYLTLYDYEWMQYILKTRFHTEKQGNLDVEFMYFGSTIAEMYVDNRSNGEHYTYQFQSHIFIKYIKRYLKKHIKQWRKKYAFNGEEIAIDLYNEVLRKGIVVKENGK